MNDVQLTTGQMSGITLVGYMSLYRYVRDFPEFFSPTARQHKRGRRWTLDDLEVVQAIRYLYHERAGRDKIRETLSGGWRPVANSAYDLETFSRLIEATLAVSEEAKRIVKDAQKAIDDVKFCKLLSREDHIFVGAMELKMHNIQKEVEQIRLTLKREKKRKFTYI